MNAFRYRTAILPGVIALLSALSLGGCFTSGEPSDPTGAVLALFALTPAPAPAARPCAGKSASLPDGVFIADTVTAAPGATGSGYGDTACLTDGVRGGGEFEGSLDVFSLDATGAGSYVILEWSGKKITNGPGADFIVFENAFRNKANSALSFIEPVIVEVSRDRSRWCGFNPDYTATPETQFSSESGKWLRFAGIAFVLYNQETNPLNATDIFDPIKAGGDFFDLTDLSAVSNSAGGEGCDADEVSAIQSNGFVYLRLTSASARVNPDTGARFGQDSDAAGGPDIDGVIARHAANR